MPPNIGQITCLKSLTLFVVGEKIGCHLAELKGLNLGGELHIKDLHRVGNLMDAKEAKLSGKQNLRGLRLSWAGESEFEHQENAEKVLEALVPHPDLKRLIIEGYKGIQFPLWMTDQILGNVVHVTLSNCKNCSQLPPLGQLPSLRCLELSGMNRLLYIEHNIQGGGLMRGFPSLEDLRIKDLPSLQSLSREDVQLLPHLTDLSITNCPKLSLPCRPSVKTLIVLRCNDVLLRSISNLRSLTSLSIFDNDESIYLPGRMLQNFTTLRYLSLYNFNKLKTLPTELVSLNHLSSLHIANCHELESFPKQGLKGLNNLRFLSLCDSGKLRSLSEGLQHLSNLQQLILNGCPELVSLPDGIKHLSSLQELTISGKSTAIDGNAPGNATSLHKLMVDSYNLEQPIACPKLAVLPEALRHACGLQSLCISCYPDLASLPQWLGNLTSLHSLQIFDCPKLSTLPASNSEPH